eukprot:jgi/Bigna1/75442/fgenesh1_pg.34_\
MTSSSEIKSSKPQWETLGSQKVVDKENTVAISKWSSGPLNAPKDGDAKKKKKTSLRDVRANHKTITHYIGMYSMIACERERCDCLPYGVQIGGASRRRRGRHRHRSRRAVAAANESKIATVSAEKQPITIFQDPGLQPKKIGVREATEGKKTTGGGLHAHATGIDHSGESSSLVGPYFTIHVTKSNLREHYSFHFARSLCLALKMSLQCRCLPLECNKGNVSNPLKNFSVEEKGVVEEDKAAGAVAPVHDENSNPNCLN